jgi:hypothetical protein
MIILCAWNCYFQNKAQCSYFQVSHQYLWVFFHFSHQLLMGREKSIMIPKFWEILEEKRLFIQFSLSNNICFSLSLWCEGTPINYFSSKNIGPLMVFWAIYWYKLPVFYTNFLSQTIFFLLISSTFLLSCFNALGFFHTQKTQWQCRFILHHSLILCYHKRNVYTLHVLNLKWCNKSLLYSPYKTFNFFKYKVLQLFSIWLLPERFFRNILIT